jgi:group I intron endonuclease
MGKARKIIAVYQIRNLVSGSFYIGSTTNLYERWRTHRKKLRSDTHPNKHLQATWNKHGEEAFRFEILAEFESVNDMETAEEGLLEQAIQNKKCCNISPWAKTPWRNRGHLHPLYGTNLTDEQKQNLRDAAKRQWKTSDPRTGRKHSEQTKAKIKAAVAVAYSEGRGGAYLRPSEETRKKMSEAQKGNQYAKGHIRTEEHRRKLSEANKGNQHWKGKNHSEEAKAKMGQAVKMIDPNGNETIYPRTTAIKEEFGIFLPTIQRSVRSGRPLAKGPYKGWRFEYV